VVARAVHDYLYTYRMGQVAATLNILSVDLRSGTVLVSRNNPAPFFVLDGGQVHSHSEPSTPIGLHAGTKPRITEIPLRENLYVVVFSDGLLKAGQRFGEDLDIVNFLSAWPVADGAPPLAEALLTRAMDADRGAPADDMSIVVLAALPNRSVGRTRRMWVSLPVERMAPDERGEHDVDEDLG
jgi:serine phosphatase RsbU (regulator of sigma subunit)